MMNEIFSWEADGKYVTDNFYQSVMFTCYDHENSKKAVKYLNVVKENIRTELCQTLCACCEENMSTLVQDDSGVWCHDFDEDGLWTPCDASDILNLECWGN